MIPGWRPSPAPDCPGVSRHSPTSRPSRNPSSNPGGIRTSRPGFSPLALCTVTSDQLRRQDDGPRAACTTDEDASATAIRKTLLAALCRLCGPTAAGPEACRTVASGVRFNEGVAGGLRTRDDHPAGAHRSCVAERTLGDPGAGTPQPRGRVAAAPRRACWSHAESCQVAPDRSCWARPLPVRQDEPRFRLKPGDSPGAPEFAADVWSGLRQHRQLRARRRRCLEETCHVRADHYRDRPGPR